MPDNDPISILTSDHERVRKLFARLEREEPTLELVDMLAEMLEQHTEIEEDIFYPAFLEAAEQSEHEHMYYEAIEEHDLVDTVMAELDPETLDPPVLLAKVKVLKDLVLHHLDEEENQLFPIVRKLCSEEQLSQLGDRVQERHESLMQASEAGEEAEQTRAKAGTRGTLNLNIASVDQLRSIEGIDELRASRLVEYRESHGQFADWRDISQIEGFDEGMVRALQNQASL